MGTRSYEQPVPKRLVWHPDASRVAGHIFLIGNARAGKAMHIGELSAKLSADVCPNPDAQGGRL